MEAMNMDSVGLVSPTIYWIISPLALLTIALTIWWGTRNTVAVLIGVVPFIILNMVMGGWLSRYAYLVWSMIFMAGGILLLGYALLLSNRRDGDVR